MLTAVYNILVSLMPLMVYVLPFFGFFAVSFTVNLIWRLFDV